jgi:hypothetical protein
MRKLTSAAVIIAAVSAVSSIAQAASLVGQWTFNEGGGSVALDSSGNGNNASLNSDLGPLGTPGYISTGSTNLGLSLDPSYKQWVNYGSSPLFTGTGTFSLESWFTIRSIPPGGGEAQIFGRDHTLIGTTMYTNGNCYSYVGGGSLYVSAPLNAMQKYHLVQTWDGATISVYLDGALAGTFASTTAPPSDPSPLISGKPGPSDGAGYLDMILDEARIYSGALTAGEVAADFAAGPVQMSPQWIAQSGDWHNFANWVGLIPNGVGSAAFFKGSISASRTVYTDIATTVGTLSFDSANTYVIAGSATLSLEVSTGSAAIDLISGSHKINLPLDFVSDTNINVASGQTLTIGNPATIKANKTVIKNGNVVIQAPLTIETGGSLVIGPGAASLFGAPSLATGAKINVQNHSMTIDYRGQATPAATIKSQLKDGYNNGAWNGDGINTTSGTAITGLGWRDNAGTSSIDIKYTYYGDADLSGTVSSTDFNALVAGYGATTGAVWAQGDFNYDGKVNTKDFNYLAGNFGQTIPAALPGSGLGAVVPEPATAGFLMTAAVAVMIRRRR